MATLRRSAFALFKRLYRKTVQRSRQAAKQSKRVYEINDVFTKILEEGLAQNQIPGKTEKARKWYRERAMGELTVTEDDAFRSLRRLKGTPLFGKLYMYKYWPKHIDKLPYHDRFPAVFPFERADGGFLGINLHYLPPDMRAGLMDMLYTTAASEIDEKSKINISYELLKSFSTFDIAKPCIKRYLFSQVKSRFVEIRATEWDIALFLPLERFAKGRSAPGQMAMQEAHQDSIGHKK